MPLKQLDHVNVRTNNLDTMMTWYTNILGMHSGDRPNLPTSGAWMYVGDQAVVHLIAANGTARVGSEVDLKLEHFALSAAGMKEFELNLAAVGANSYVVMFQVASLRNSTFGTRTATTFTSIFRQAKMCKLTHIRGL